MTQITISNGNPVQVTVEHRPNEFRNSAIGKAAEAAAAGLREFIQAQNALPPAEVPVSEETAPPPQTNDVPPEEAAGTSLPGAEIPVAEAQPSAPIEADAPVTPADGPEGTDGPVGSAGVAE